MSGKKLTELSTLKLHALKLLSLLVAFFIWFYVLNSEPLTVDLQMPISVETVEGTAVANELPESITVTIKGPRVFIRNLKQSNREKIYVQLKRKEKHLPITRTVMLTENMISLPLGVSVEDIKPASIKIRLERKIKKLVPIVPSYVGEIDKKYRLVKKTFSVKEVMISGPIEVMRKISKVRTKPIDLSLLRKSGELLISIVQPDKRIVLKQDSVIFKYALRPKSANLMLRNIKIRFLSSRRRIFSKTKVAALSVLVEEGEERKIRERDVQVIADIPENRRGKIKVTLRARLPESVHLLKIFPEEITVNVK